MQINILHVSDLHFCAAPRRSARGVFLTYQDAQAADDLAVTAEVLHQAGSLSAILVTGDLATTGIQDDLLAAHAYLSSPRSAPDPLSPWTLGRLSPYLPIGVIPGNHDRYQMPLGIPGNTEFENVFAGGSPGVAVALRDGVLVFVVLGVDLSLPVGHSINPLEYLGRGLADVQRLTAAVNATNNLRLGFQQQGLTAAVAWAVHFPPGARRSLSLIDEANLEHHAALAGVSLVFCGHTHRTALLRRGPVQFVVAGTATAAREKRSVNLVCVSVENDGGINNLIVNTLNHNARTGRFV